MLTCIHFLVSIYNFVDVVQKASCLTLVPVIALLWNIVCLVLGSWIPKFRQ